MLTPLNKNAVVSWEFLSEQRRFNGLADAFQPVQELTRIGLTVIGTSRLTVMGSWFNGKLAEVC